MTSDTAPTDRILALAAYARDRAAQARPITLTDVVDDVPGYRSDAARDGNGQLVGGTREWETVRKRLTRDIDELRRGWGISLDYDDAAHTYRLAPPFLTRAERRALLAAAATVAVQGPPRAQPGELGAAIDDHRALVVLRLHELVAQLRAAIGSRSRVQFAYDGRSRTIEPYALGMWRNRWYLAGLDAGTEWSADSLRRFRLDRVETDRAPVLTVEPGTDAYAIPADFDPDTAFDLDPNSWGTDPLVRARIRVSPDHVDAFVDELGGDVLVEDGATFVDLDVRHYDSLRTRLLGFGTNAVVMSPPELVGLVRDHLAALAASDRGPES